MKYLIYVVMALSLLASPVMAQDYDHGRDHHQQYYRHHHDNWRHRDWRDEQRHHDYDQDWSRRGYAYQGDYGAYLQHRQPGQGLIPMEPGPLQGVLFVIGGLAGPAAFLFAAP